MRSNAAVPILVAALLLLAACSRGAPDPTSDGAAAEPVTVQVVLTEYGIEPPQITVPAHTPLAFEIMNRGVQAHDFVIARVAASELLASHQKGTLRVDGLEPGTYDVICGVAGHAGAGMVATLVVTGDGAVAAGHGGGAGHEMSAEEMAAKHDAVVAAFPAATEGRGNLPLEPVVAADGTKVFELSASEIDWEVAPGDVRGAMAYNGMVPGPRIDVDLGDRVRIVLTNELEVPTALHLHGLILPNAMDGVPGLTQPSILPGGSFTYEFVARPSGTHMYHSHFDSARQVPSGLLGAFIVHAPDEPEADLDVVMVLNDGPLGYTLNGKGFPATEPIVLKLGQTARIRYMNEGLEIHPMHLHGLPQVVIAKDGHPLAAPYTADNVLVAPGDRVDVLVAAIEVGAWALHCHVLTHAEGPDGMFGMVTAVVVEE